jgi:hypothetical protein
MGGDGDAASSDSGDGAAASSYIGVSDEEVSNAEAEST